MTITQADRDCVCMEVFGEDPDCPIHGLDSDWALENLSAAEWQFEVARLRMQLHERHVIRIAALEEAAKVCEAQQQTFLSPQYSTDQPMSSFGERFACGRCAEAIRNLAGEG